LSNIADASNGKALRIVKIESDSGEWDRYVESAPVSTHCHRAGWRDVMSDTLGHECHYLVAQDEQGAWRGVLPIVRVRGLLGHFLVSMPFLNDGGPLGDDLAQTQLVKFAVDRARRIGATLVEFRTRQPINGPVTISNRKITVHLELPDSVEALWERTFRAKLRSQIRRPAKDGMVARCGSDQLGAFYEVFARNMRDLGTPVLSRRFFERVAAIFPDDVLFAVVYTANGIPVAAGCGFQWRDEFEVTWASSLREYNPSSPNMLLYSTLMEQSIAKRVRQFNFGRCTFGGPTHKFKRQWGGADVDLPWAFWSQTSATGTPSPDKPLLRIATAVWSRLPLRVANGLGPLVARQLP
jgi:FemAB-related protein (PEP-CTERM system-associated)